MEVHEKPPEVLRGPGGGDEEGNLDVSLGPISPPPPPPVVHGNAGGDPLRVQRLKGFCPGGTGDRLGLI